jgi:phosphoglycolate phosphatase-like HAD superfamily hydrolase
MHARKVPPIRTILFDKDGTLVDLSTARTSGPTLL